MSRMMIGYGGTGDTAYQLATAGDRDAETAATAGIMTPGSVGSGGGRGEEEIVHYGGGRRHHPQYVNVFPRSRVRVAWMAFFYYFSLAYNTGFFLLYLPIAHPEGPKLADNKTVAEFGWHTVSFGWWIGVMQAVFYLVCIIDLHSRHKRPRNLALRIHRDRFYDVAFALSMFVGVAYWVMVFPHRLRQHDVRTHARRFFFFLFFPISLSLFLSFACSFARGLLFGSGRRRLPRPRPKRVVSFCRIFFRFMFCCV